MTTGFLTPAEADEADHSLEWAQAYLRNPFSEKTKHSLSHFYMLAVLFRGRNYLCKGLGYRQAYCCILMEKYAHGWCHLRIQLYTIHYLSFSMVAMSVGSLSTMYPAQGRPSPSLKNTQSTSTHLGGQSRGGTSENKRWHCCEAQSANRLTDNGQQWTLVSDIYELSRVCRRACLHTESRQVLWSRENNGNKQLKSERISAGNWWWSVEMHRSES